MPQEIMFQAQLSSWEPPELFSPEKFRKVLVNKYIRLYFSYNYFFYQNYVSRHLRILETKSYR
jgi:hypothetical protein